MPRNLTPLGHARVYRHPATGELVVDTDSLRRSGFAGEFGYEEDFYAGTWILDRIYYRI